MNFFQKSASSNEIHVKGGSNYKQKSLNDDLYSEENRKNLNRENFEPWPATSPDHFPIHPSKQFDNATNFSQKKKFGSFVQSMNTPLNKRNSLRSNSPFDNMSCEMKKPVTDQNYFIKERMDSKHKMLQAKSINAFNGNAPQLKKI